MRVRSTSARTNFHAELCGAPCETFADAGASTGYYGESTLEYLTIDWHVSLAPIHGFPSKRLRSHELTSSMACCAAGKTPSQETKPCTAPG